MYIIMTAIIIVNHACSQWLAVFKAGNKSRVVTTSWNRQTTPATTGIQKREPRNLGKVFFFSAQPCQWELSIDITDIHGYHAEL